MKPLLIGCEPANADDAFKALKNGARVGWQGGDTICDSLTGYVGDINFELIKLGCAEIVRVSDAEVVAAMQHMADTCRFMPEPGGAITYAAQTNRSFVDIKIQFNLNNVVNIISGGN
eukprot:CAMPEP_0116989488 /NCGR_PEP_ID=MMETSP0467-20121206/64850_1 /TAXON_ID=283647 /ORGANISM="Mesodinium pulex, Strain SPMC105" /LENGTH=116 /DNA_ID=CAMNT_0004685945 /DNA_START=728 /DNA_END=1078 /DNA_ORIENTATION=+